MKRCVYEDAAFWTTQSPSHSRWDALFEDIYSVSFSPDGSTSQGLELGTTKYVYGCCVGKLKEFSQNVD